jgi:hypothetical protein
MDISRVFAAESSSKYSLFILLSLAAAVYLMFPTRDFYWDGIIYAQFIEDSPGFGAHLFHPNHLLYNFVGYLAYHAAQGLGLQTRALFVLQFVTIIFSLAGAFVFFRIVRLSFGGEYLSLALTALFAFAAAWWRFSTDADVYIISVFFLLVGFYLILPNQTARPFLAAFAHSFAMLFHELAVLFFPVVILGLLFQTASCGRRDQAETVLKYAAAAFLLTFGTYCLSFYLLTGGFDARSFFVWVTSFAPDAEVSRNAWQSLSLTLRGHRQMFLDGSSRLFDRSALSVFLLIPLVGATLILIIQVVRNRREISIWRRALAGQKIYRRPLFLLCAAWILPYLLFLFIFIPGNTFYRLFYFPAVIVLCGILFAPFENLNLARRGRLALLAIVLCLYNFLFYIYPNSRVRKNTPLALASEANRVWSEKTVVFHVPTAAFDSLDTNNRLVRYFNPSVAWKPLNYITLEQFESEVRTINRAGGAVWLDASAFERLSADSETAAWLEQNAARGNNETELNLPSHKMKYIRINANSPE